MRVRMKRAKAQDPSDLLKEKEDPRGREIVNELKPQARDMVFQKRRPDGFVGTELRHRRAQGLRRLAQPGAARAGFKGTNSLRYRHSRRDCRDLAIEVKAGRGFFTETIRMFCQ